MTEILPEVRGYQRSHQLGVPQVEHHRGEPGAGGSRDHPGETDTGSQTQSGQRTPRDEPCGGQGRLGEDAAAADPRIVPERHQKLEITASNTRSMVSGSEALYTRP